VTDATARRGIEEPFDPVGSTLAQVIGWARPFLVAQPLRRLLCVLRAWTTASHAMPLEELDLRLHTTAASSKKGARGRPV
jgi:hypothetical protein